MSDWYEKAMLQLEKDLDESLISDDEFRSYMADLNAEYEESRQDAAREAYENY